MSSHIQQVRPPQRLSLFLPLAVLAGVSIVVARAVISGGQALRGAMLGGLAALMALPLLLSLEAGLVAMMLFEPFRGFIRRAQYLIVDYSKTDPIHLLTPLITFSAFVVLWRLHGHRIFWASPQAKLVSILALVYLLEIFNPLQEGLFFGLTGAMFFLVPMAWFYFGQQVKLNFIATVLRLMIVIGLLTSLYGIYQMVFGYPSFEQYWIEHNENYLSINVGNVKRAVATFCSAEEWGRYLQLSAVIAFGYGLSVERLFHRAAWLVAGVLLSAMLFFTGQRISIFGLILGVVVWILLGARTWGGVWQRLALLLIPATLIVIMAKPPGEEAIQQSKQDQVSETLVAHSMRGTLNPTAEGSFQARLDNWAYLATNVVPYRPFGLGLGATTIGMVQFGNLGDEYRPTDGYIIGLVIACGLPTAVFCLWILCRTMLLAVRAYRRATPGAREAGIWRVVASLMPSLVFTTVFGNSLAIYSIAPIGWLLIGWIGAEEWQAKK